MNRYHAIRPTKRTKFNRSVESARPVNLIPATVQSETNLCDVVHARGPSRITKLLNDVSLSRIINRFRVAATRASKGSLARTTGERRIKRLINDSRRLMMAFEDADIDSTMPSRSRGYRSSDRDCERDGIRRGTTRGRISDESLQQV